MDYIVYTVCCDKHMILIFMAIKWVFLSSDQAALRRLLSVRPSVTPFSQCFSHRIILDFQELLLLTNVMSTQKVVVRGQRSRSESLLQLKFLEGYEIMHKAWSSIEEVPYCFSRSPLKFQGHRRHQVADFYPNSVFPDCNFSLNSPITMT